MKKSFTTTIEDTLQDRFKDICKENNLKMNEVIEALMQAYIDGVFKVETSYSVKIVKDK